MKRVTKIRPFKVVSWDFNRDSIEYYDIMPHFLYTFKNLKKDKRPTGFENIKEWFLKEAQYQFWSRCEYEVIITGWPKQKKEVKIDIYQQIVQNIDTITELFISELGL